MSRVTARRANHLKPVQPSREKYSASRCPQITPTTPAIPRPRRGAYRDRHGRRVRGAVAAARRARNKFSQGELAHERRPRADERRDRGRQSRVVLAPVAGVKPAEVLRTQPGFAKTFNPPATEAKGIRLRGEHGISREPIAQGMPGCSGCTCMLVCASSSANCTRDRGCQPAPGIPCALFLGRNDVKSSGAIRREIAKSYSVVIARLVRNCALGRAIQYSRDSND